MHRVAVTLAVCALLASCEGGGVEPARPHVFLVTSDTLRADHLSLFGYDRATSPTIDALAGQAWSFEDAVTVVPKTGPSFATIFTGRHPRAHGVRSNFDAVPSSLPVLPERLRERGYETAAFVGNPVLRREIGFGRGFDVYEIVDGKRGEGVLSVNRAFFAWAAERDWSRPAFVWVHYMDPHGPYTPPPELAARFTGDERPGAGIRVPPAPAEPPSGNPNKILGAIPAYQQIEGEDRASVYVARYDAEILYMDTALAELLAYINERGLFDPSAVVFTSDHGESLGEHDYWFEHGWFAFEPTLRVPLLVKAPGQTEGRVVERQVSTLDLYPTLLALGGASPERGLAGGDLLDLDEARPQAVLIESSDRYPEKYLGLRTGRWKYLVRERDGAEELYDLEADPRELTDVAAENPGVLAEHRQTFRRELDLANERAVPRESGLPDDPETLERLRSLGYLGH